MDHILNARRRFLERHHIDSLLVEAIVYVYYVAFYAFWPIAALLFWSYFAVNPALTVAVFLVVGLIITKRLRSN